MAQTSFFILLFLSLINLFNYIDRYILAALLPAIQKDLVLSDVQLGLLGTAFVVIYMIAAPVFGYLGDRGRRNFIIASGVGLWSLATASAALAKNFISLLSSRMGVGVGEAAYASIGPALLADYFPKKLRGRIYAIFFMAIPVGSALGYILGGILEAHFGWRQAFLFAGVPGLLFAVALCFLSEPERGQYDDEKPSQQKISISFIIKKLFSNNSYILIVLGYAAYTFVLGGLAFWTPTYVVRYWDLSLQKANILFGGITVLTGLLGTFLGGFLGDIWEKHGGDGYLKISATSVLLSVPFFILLIATKTLALFVAFLFIVELLLFFSTSPINAEIVNCVPVALRASASAICILVIHLLGDAISPTLIGWLSVRSNLNAALYVCPIVLILSGILWAWKVIRFWVVMPWPQTWKMPKWQAHRGYHLSGVQENTLDAFRLAKAKGAPMIELDVHLAKDGTPVVVHDDNLARIANTKQKVADLLPAELLKLAKISTLEAVLSDPEVPHFINIELKNDKYCDVSMEEAVAQVVKKTSAQQRVLFSSFNPLALRRIAHFLPNVPRGLLVTQASDPGNFWYLKQMYLAFLAKPHLVHLDKKMITNKLVQEFTRRKISIAVWTVKNQEEASRYLALGIVSVISDEVLHL